MRWVQRQVCSEEVSSVETGVEILQEEGVIMRNRGVGRNSEKYRV